MGLGATSGVEIAFVNRGGTVDAQACRVAAARFEDGTAYVAEQAAPHDAR